MKCAMQCSVSSESVQLVVLSRRYTVTSLFSFPWCLDVGRVIGHHEGPQYRVFVGIRHSCFSCA